MQATSPGRVPGSKAVYEKQINATGKTTQYTKTEQGVGVVEIIEKYYTAGRENGRL